MTCFEQQQTKARTNTRPEYQSTSNYLRHMPMIANNRDSSRSQGSSARIALSSRSNEPKRVPLSDNFRSFHSRSLLPSRSHLSLRVVVLVREYRKRRKIFAMPSQICLIINREGWWFIIDRSNATIVPRPSRAARFRFRHRRGNENRVAEASFHPRIDRNDKRMSHRGDMTKVDLRLADATR